jgi:hypothetical protein
MYSQSKTGRDFFIFFGKDSQASVVCTALQDVHRQRIR